MLLHKGQDCSQRNKKRKEIHFYLCQISFECVNFLSDMDFSVATVQSKNKTTFSYETSFYLYKSMKDKKKRKKVCGSEGRTSVTNCGIRMRKQSECLQKKINANKQCKWGKNKIKGYPLSKCFLLDRSIQNISTCSETFLLKMCLTP